MLHESTRVCCSAPPGLREDGRVYALNKRIRLNFALVLVSLFPASNSVELALMQPRGMSERRERERREKGGKKKKKILPFFS